MQEFLPPSQSAKADELSDAEIARQRPSSWSSHSRTGDVTKSEHPSAYEEEPLPPYSYAAQDRRPTNAEPGERGEQPASSGASTEMPPHRQQRFSPDGDAMEYGYRPFRTTTRTQSQRQQKRHIGRWIMLALLIILLIKVIPLLAGLVITLLGIGLFLILLPILIVLAFVLIFGGLVLFILSRLGFPVWQNLYHRRRWNSNRHR